MRKYGKYLLILCVCLILLLTSVSVYALERKVFFTHVARSVHFYVAVEPVPTAYVNYHMFDETEDDFIVVHADKVTPGEDYTILSADEANALNAGYLLLLWNTEADGSGENYLPGAIIFEIEDGIDLYAQWAEALIITYHANTDDEEYVSPDENDPDALAGAVARYSLDISYAIEAAAGENHKLITAKDAGFMREGYIFIGWNTEKDGSGDDYAPGAVITLTESIDLYAQWKAIGDEPDQQEEDPTDPTDPINDDPVDPSDDDPTDDPNAGDSPEDPSNELPDGNNNGESSANPSGETTP